LFLENNLKKEDLLWMSPYTYIIYFLWILKKIQYKLGWGTNFKNINFDSCKILASTVLLGPTKY
jgi:hypothetical protein